MSDTGAWFLGGYRKGMAGTIGESLDLADRDHLGWTLRSWKYELAYNQFRGKMILDVPALGDAADHQIRAFQAKIGVAADGVIDQRVGMALLEKRIRDVADAYRLPRTDFRGIVRHESDGDIGAIGQDDHLDRGPVQEHIWPGGSLTLSQAIRPVKCFSRLGAQLARIRAAHDLDSAVVSWNIGEGGAEWWYSHGKPKTGSPSWWPYGDLAARATAYLGAVRALGG